MSVPLRIDFCFPVVFANLGKPDGSVCLPISPSKIFVAVNAPARLRQLRALPPRDIVHNSNRHLVGRARRFVWAHDRYQTAFVEKRVSQRTEPVPLFPGIGRYPSRPWSSSGPLYRRMFCQSARFVEACLIALVVLCVRRK